MSKYTTELRYPLEQRFKERYPDYEGEPDPYTVCQGGRDQLFDFYYPINADDQERFEINFCLHYYTREIGSETLGLFKLRLQSRLNELIPKYNLLWNQMAEMAEINLYDDTDLQTIRAYGQTVQDRGTLTKTGTENFGHGHVVTKTGSMSHEFDNFRDQTVTGKTGTDTDTTVYTGTENRSSDVTERVSDTPMGTIDNMSSVTGNMYLSAAKLTHTDAPTSFTNRQDVDTTQYGSTTTTTRTPTGKELDVYNNLAETHSGTDTTSFTNRQDANNNDRTYGGRDTVTTTGKAGGKSYAEEMVKARQLFTNVDQMLINDLRSLFMRVW